MNKINSWLASIAFGLLWVGLRELYLWVQTSSQLLSSGLGPIWLAVVVAYFVADTGLVLAYMYVMKAPLGKPIPKGFPFWYLVPDTVVLTLFVHLAFLCVDQGAMSRLALMGLGSAYLIFMAGGTCWVVVAGCRYLSLRRLYLRLADTAVMNKTGSVHSRNEVGRD